MIKLLKVLGSVTVCAQHRIKTTHPNQNYQELFCSLRVNTYAPYTCDVLG
jgi:hypothetical protein